jgi:hypothetical protein
LRIKPYFQEVEEAERRAEQRRAFLRRQTYGLILIAALVLLWRLIHTRSGWIFPAGWWRL